MESMSLAPHLLPRARTGYRMGHGELQDSMVLDGLTNAFTHRQMFDETSEVSDEHGWKREELDAWAAGSQDKAIAAQDAGRHADEIVPVTIKGRKGDTVVDTDEGPRRGTTAEVLAKLPGLVKGGSHTAGNSPGVNDGAAALVLASEEWATENGKEILGEIVSFGQAAGEFPNLLTTPGKASAQALAKAGIEASEVAVWEINEAFSSVALNTIKDLGIDPEKVNVNGGAVALGHPLGASGARIIGSLVLELRRRGGGYGIATACSGTGQGDAILIKV
jgi:acetyl-CoA C-acetyltransferase